MSVSNAARNPQIQNAAKLIENGDEKVAVKIQSISNFRACNDLLDEFEAFSNGASAKGETENRQCRSVSEGDLERLGRDKNGAAKLFIGQRAQFSISNSDRKRSFRNVLLDHNSKKHRTTSHTEEMLCHFGDTPTAEPLDNPQTPPKPSRRRRLDRLINPTNGTVPTPPSLPSDFLLHHNNNNLKNERLSPGTPDTSSRSRSVTPSSASHPDTPPAQPEQILPPSGRNYSDFMRSLAAKYNNANPNDYFSAARNGFPPPLDQRFKASFPGVLQNIPTPPAVPGKEEVAARKQPDFASLVNPFASPAMFPPLIDMSTTQALIAMVRTAKEAELQGLLKNVKRPEPSSPLDLSAAAPAAKRPRTKTPGLGALGKRAESESPRLHEDVAGWSVDDVCNFVAGIDICAEYARNFREQRIDGSGLPLLTEDHLTSTMNMKLGPALKLRSILAKNWDPAAYACTARIAIEIRPDRPTPAPPPEATPTPEDLREDHFGPFIFFF